MRCASLANSIRPDLRRRLLAPLSVLCVSFVTSGCVALAVGGAGAGAGGLAYAKGNKKRTYNHPIDDVSQAALNALTELDLNVAHAAHDQLTGRIDAYTSTGDHVKIKLENLGQATELDVRVNTFGSNSMSHMILDKIDQQLPQSTQLTGVATPHPLPEAAPKSPTGSADRHVPLQMVQRAPPAESPQPAE